MTKITYHDLLELEYASDTKDQTSNFQPPLITSLQTVKDSNAEFNLKNSLCKGALLNVKINKADTYDDLRSIIKDTKKLKICLPIWNQMGNFEELALNIAKSTSNDIDSPITMSNVNDLISAVNKASF